VLPRDWSQTHYFLKRTYYYIGSDPFVVNIHVGRTSDLDLRHQAMSSFRASPWVTYEPSIPSRTRQQPDSDAEMDEDIEMDAPQISTLREEESPPPQPPKKNIIHIKKRPTITPLTSLPSDKTPDGNDEEEDQLIDELINDDGDDDPTKPSSPSQPTAGRSNDSPQKRKASAKRKPRKSDKKLGEGEKKVKEKVSQPTVHH